MNLHIHTAAMSVTNIRQSQAARPDRIGGRGRHGVLAARRDAELLRRIKWVLWNDPATGVMRHADAGYGVAKDCAREHGLRLPRLG
jgi:hypothetical protein